MGQTVLRLVQSDETIRLMFDRRPQQEKNNDWSVRGYIIPGEAVIAKVEFSLWLKPGSKVNKALVYNHAGQAEIEVTYRDSNGALKDFRIPLAILDNFSKTETFRFEEHLL